MNSYNGVSLWFQNYSRESNLHKLLFSDGQVMQQFILPPKWYNLSTKPEYTDSYICAGHIALNPFFDTIQYNLLSWYQLASPWPQCWFHQFSLESMNSHFFCETDQKISSTWQIKNFSNTTKSLLSSLFWNIVLLPICAFITINMLSIYFALNHLVIAVFEWHTIRERRDLQLSFETSWMWNTFDNSNKLEKTSFLSL